MLLYIHFPFCRKKCIYCSFYSIPYDEYKVNLYFNALREEIKHWSSLFKKPKISTIYLGGGTPTILDLNYLEKLVLLIKDSFKFDKSVEFTIEANPESVSLPYLKSLLQLGINRISIGIQSLDDKILRWLGRLHDAKTALWACEWASEAGFQNISVDLLWGLPSQTVKSWLSQLGKIVKLNIKHISVYALTVEEGTVLYKMVKQGLVKLPKEWEQVEMYLQGGEFLESCGFLQYEISNFAKLGFICQHNMGYWEGRPYLGIGPGAVSTIGSYRWENPKNIKEYVDMIFSKQMPKNVEKLSEEDKKKEKIILSLRTVRGLSLKEYKNMMGNDLLEEKKDLISYLYKNDFIKIRNGYLSLSKKGMLVSNSILTEFI